MWWSKKTTKTVPNDTITPEKESDSKLDALETHEQKLIDTVIYLLTEHPDHFSAKWFTGKHLDNSVQSNDNKINIMIYNGQICSPTEPNMSKDQLSVVKKLVSTIVERDSKTLIDDLLNSVKKEHS